MSDPLPSSLRSIGRSLRLGHRAEPLLIVVAGITTIAQALRLDAADVTRLGPDLRITAVPAAPVAPTTTLAEEN